MFLDDLKGYFKKSRAALFTGFAAAVVVFVIYVIVSLIVWNSTNISYGITYAIAAFFISFIVQRLLGYIITKKEGVIKEHK